MRALRHAPAAVGPRRQAVPVDDRHPGEPVRQHPRGRQAGHPRTDDHGVAGQTRIGHGFSFTVDRPTRRTSDLARSVVVYLGNDRSPLEDR